MSAFDDIVLQQALKNMVVCIAHTIQHVESKTDELITSAHIVLKKCGYSDNQASALLTEILEELKEKRNAPNKKD